MNFLKRKYQERKQQFKQGVNVIKTISNTPKFIQNLKYGHDDFPYSFRQVYEPAKDMTVFSLEIIRNPLQKPLQGLLSAFTGFELERKLKEQNYDSLFHLKIRINGKFDFEKEQAVHFRHATNNKDQEILRVNPVPNITIGQLVENTKNKMGNAFFTYDGLKNNCQDFVLEVLHANGIHNPEYDKFIKQDTDEAFKSTPSLMRQMMNRVTDVANRAQILTEGSGLEQYPDILSNFQILHLCKLLKIPKVKVIMKNQLTMKNFRDGCYVMNLENTGQSGSHWTAFIRKGDTVFYADSFGAYPPQKEYNIFLKSCKDILINKKQFQAYKSERCGWFAIMFLWYMTNFGINKNTLLNYLKIYNFSNLKANDDVKILILQKIHINQNN